MSYYVYYSAMINDVITIRELRRDWVIAALHLPRIISAMPQIARGEEKTVTAEAGESKLQFETGSL